MNAGEHGQTDCTACARATVWARTYLVTRFVGGTAGPENEDGRAVGTESRAPNIWATGPTRRAAPAGTKKSGPATAAGGLAIKVLIAAAVVAACCCCAMAVGPGTAATLGREEDDDLPGRARDPAPPAALKAPRR